MKKFKIRILPVAALSGAILLVAAYFFVTGSFFLTRVVVPLASRLSGVRFAAGEIDWRPWNARLTVRRFRLGDEKEPFLEIRRVRGFYNFFQCIRGVISFREVDASGVRLRFISDGDRQWNFLRLATPQDEESAMDSDIGLSAMEFTSVAIEESEVLVSVRRSGQTHELTFSGLELKTPFFGTGRPMDLVASGRAGLETAQSFEAETDFDGTLRIEWGRNLEFEHGVLESRWRKFTSLINDYRVGESELDWKLDVRRGNGLWKFNEIKLTQGDGKDKRGFFDGSGSVSDHGAPLAFKVRHFLLPEELIALGSELFYGVNPGLMKIEGNGTLEWSRERVSAAGEWRLDREPGMGYFDGEGIDLPGFTMRSKQDFSIDFASRQIEVESLRLELTESDRSALRLYLRNPVNYDLARLSTNGDRPGVTLEVSDFDLKLLRFAMPENQRMRFDAGSVSGAASFDFTRDLTGAKIHGGFAAQKVGFHIDHYQRSNLDAKLDWDSEVGQNLSLAFSRFILRVGRPDAVFAELDARGSFLPGKKSGNASFELRHLSESLLLLLPEEMHKDLQGELRPFMPLTGKASGKFDFNPERLRVDEVNLELESRQATRSSARLETQEFAFPGLTPKFNWKIQLNADWPLLEVNRFLPEKMLRFSEGQFRAAIRFDGSGDFATATANGNFSMNNVAGRLGSTHFRDVIIQDEFSFYRPENGRIQLNANTLYWRVSGRPALRIETPGSFDPVSREWESRVAVRYLNEKFLGLFLPGRIQDGLVSGNLKLTGRDDEEIKANGHFQLEKIRPVDDRTAFDGLFNFEFDHSDGVGSNLRRSRLRLHSGPRQLIDAELSGVISADRSRPIAVRLTSYAGDLAALRERGSAAGAPILPAPEKLKVAPKVTLHQPWNFGERPIDLRLNLNNLNWGPHADFGLSGLFRFQENRVAAKNAILMFNGCPLRISCNMLDTAAGMVLSCSGKAEQPIELGALASLFRPGLDLHGDVNELKWNLNIRNVFADNVLETISGSADGRFGNVIVSSQSLNSPYMRMLLLPVEAILRTGSLMPESADPRKVWPSLSRKLDFAQSPLAVVRLDRGDLALEFEPGVIHVRKLDFFGSLIKELKFSGEIRSDGDQRLSLISQVNMGGIRGKFPVAGTLSEPELNMEDVLMALTGGRVSEFLKNFGSAVSQIIPGGDPKKNISPEDQLRIREILKMVHPEKPAKPEEVSPK